MNKDGKKSRRQAFLALEVGGEPLKVPIALRDSIRAECYNYGVKSGRIFSMTTDKEAGIVTVTRKA